jgi:hypothetical protein
MHQVQHNARPQGDLRRDDLFAFVQLPSVRMRAFLLQLMPQRLSSMMA